MERSMNNDTPRTNRALQLSDGQWSFVLRDEARQLERELNAANERISMLTEALSLVVPCCEYLHHPKKMRHLADEDCPCEQIIRKAKSTTP
jgi:hypothetical protein